MYYIIYAQLTTMVKNLYSWSNILPGIPKYFCNLLTLFVII